jgi:hypothetical protein
MQIISRKSVQAGKGRRDELEIVFPNGREASAYRYSGARWWVVDGIDASVQLKKNLDTAWKSSEPVLERAA